MVNNGVKNELIFLCYLNEKKVKELNIIMQDLIYRIFDNISQDDIVYASKTQIPEKTDMILKIRNEEKRFSLKIGSKNSVHAEPITEFVHFLIENKIPRFILMKFLKFHYGDGTTNGKGINRMSVLEYKEKNVDDFKEINKYFNNSSFVKKCVERFILKGRNSDKCIDVLLTGKVNDFFYITKDEIFDIILNSKVESNSIHIGPLFIQPLSRNLNYNPKYENCRYVVQVKWYSLFDDILIYKNNHVCKN